MRGFRKDDFHGDTWSTPRSAVGAAPRNHRELIHGETENCDPLWGLKAPLPVRSIHGGLGGHFMAIWTPFMVVWIHGGLRAGARRNSVRYWSGTPTLARYDLENPKD